MTTAPAQADDCFLFSPSSSYPLPFACLIDRDAGLVHAWSTGLDQPDPTTDPPSYLRGWNHVELAADGSLFAMVPLHSLLKLAPDSSLLWRVELPVHHDLDVGPDGRIYVLAEQPRRVPWHDGARPLLDNTVTIIGGDGTILESYSLYDILTTHPGLDRLVEAEIARRSGASGQRVGLDALASGRETSRLLRDVPGSPFDVLHANTVEVLDDHPGGLWERGDVLVSLRDLDVIAVLDLEGRSVRWFWGPGRLSGQHQPSALPGGALLVFDNGRTAGRSRVLEIDPRTTAIVWQHTADPPQELFCALAGGCQRLGDGNVLISDAQAGRAFEITRDHRVVWDVQIHTTRTAEGSRAEFYRMAAIPAATVRLLDGDDAPARRLAAARVRCELTADPSHGRNSS